MPTHRIPSGQEALVRRMVAPEALPPRWRFVGAEVKAECIVARYRDEAGPLLVRLGHRDAGGTPASASFAVRATRQDPAAMTLLEAVLESVRALEAAFVWGGGPEDETGDEGRVGPPDVEWRAFLAGVKPAIRASVPPAEAEGVVRRYERLGGCVARSEPLPLRGEEAVLIYVAPTGAEAEALLALEASTFGTTNVQGAIPGLAQIRELGLRLGYPACCVDAFNARYGRHLREDALTPGAAAHDTWLGAVDAWVPAPRAHLNALVAPHPTLISFEPCRYDCPRALAVADATRAALVGKVEPEFLADLDATLARPVAIAADGSRAWVVLERSGDGPAEGEAVVAAEPLVGPNLEARPEAVRFAAELVGRHLGARGRVAGDGDAAGSPVVVDFSAP